MGLVADDRANRTFFSTLQEHEMGWGCPLPPRDADAKAAQAIATSEANVEKAINRLIRWFIAVAIGTMGFGASIAAVFLAD